MATTSSDDGDCPLARFLNQVVHYRGLYMSRHSAMEVCSALDQDPDLLMPVAELPGLKIDRFGAFPIADTETAFQILASRHPPNSAVFPSSPP